MTEMKPCPFCGSEDVEVCASRSSDKEPHLPDWPQWVSCNSCEASGPSYPYATDRPMTQDDADLMRRLVIGKWNDRVKVKCVHQMAREFLGGVVED